MLNGIVAINFQLILNILGIGLIFFWIVVIGWVWSDAGERTTNIYARVGYVLLVAILNVIGWLIYLIIKPSETIEEVYWSDLERRYLKYETAELGDCSKCGCQLFPGYIFCPECGNELKVKCSKCEVYVDKHDKFCVFCKNQINVRKKTEEVPTVEIMEKQIQESKDEAVEAVESDKTRYKTRKNLLKTAFNRIGKIYDGIVEGISKSVLRSYEKRMLKKGERESRKVAKKFQKAEKKKKETKKSSKKKVEKKGKDKKKSK